MRSSLLPAAALLMACLAAACSRRAPEPLTPQVSGTREVRGLAAPVRIVRDRWGVPHLFAESRDDLFFAQGFVQAQDRLFQMDLWRRAAQGRLAEVLGANFIERDAMTRRLQFHGDRSADWAASGDDSKAIAEAFVRGINAWVEAARARPPQLFVLAGWIPDFWSADDLLNRTDAFDRAAVIASVERAGFPAIVVDAVRRAAVPPFFTGLAAPLAVPTSTAAQPAPAASVDRLPSPSPYYFVHLHAPQWNAIGATAPWQPGIAIGHDGATSWKRESPALHAEVRAEPLDETGGQIIKDTIAVKGRGDPFEFESRVTTHGIVIATDRAAKRQFVFDWDGFHAGTAPAFGRRGREGQDGRERLEGREGQERREGRERQVIFAHPLAITAAARARFNIGPLPRPAGGGSPFAVSWDDRVWDASRAMNAPGQSEWPDSPNYSDLASLWSGGGSFLLAFTESAVTANAVSTLTLVPDRRR